MAADELPEELRNLSPEQLRDLQKKQCVFCRIAEGAVQARKIYEDDSFLAVLDINPATPGHILVLPKEHYSILPQFPEEQIAHLGMLAKHLAQAALPALKAHGISIVAANGLAAGQRASHFLLHIIPRMEDDGAGITLPENKISGADLQKLRVQLQPFVNRALGKDVEQEPTLSPAELPLLEKKSAQKEEKPAKKTEPKTEKRTEQKESDSKKASKPKKSNLDEIADFLAGDRK
jgi:histidine triad (HIT) family protein